MLISNPLIKFQKMYQKRLSAKTYRNYALFPLLLIFVKLVLLTTFFDAFKKKIFQQI
jgi:hypothetical protein